jgi:hypothetical protein
VTPSVRSHYSYEVEVGGLWSKACKVNARYYLKTNRRDEPVLVIIHIQLEMSQGKSLCSYLKQTRMSFFFVVYKFREQEGRTGPSCRSWYHERREEVRKGCGRVNVVQILYTHVHK